MTLLSRGLTGKTPPSFAGAGALCTGTPTAFGALFLEKFQKVRCVSYGAKTFGSWPRMRYGLIHVVND